MGSDPQNSRRAAGNTLRPRSAFNSLISTLRNSISVAGHCSAEGVPREDRFASTYSVAVFPFTLMTMLSPLTITSSTNH